MMFWKTGRNCINDYQGLEGEEGGNALSLLIAQGLKSPKLSFDFTFQQLTVMEGK